MSNSNPHQHSPHYPTRISKAALDAAQLAQQQVNTLSSILGNTAYNIAMSADVSHLLKDASYYASDAVLKQIDSMSKSLTMISSEAMREAAKSAQNLVSSIPQSVLDSITLINSAVESIKTIDFSAIATQHNHVNYEQYKPVIDALENIAQGNNNDILFDFTAIQGSSDTETVSSGDAIKEHKPVNVIAIISLILTIYNTMLGSYANLLKPSLAGEQLQIEKDQLRQSQLEYNEDVRHNTISEQQGKETLILMGKMYELLINLTNTEVEED
jgi:hypothetical protein